MLSAVSSSVGFGVFRYLHVINILDPKQPIVEAQKPIPGGGFPFDIAVDDNYAYIATNAGLLLVDLKTYAQAGYFPGYAWGIEMDADYAYVATVDRGSPCW